MQIKKLSFNELHKRQNCNHAPEKPSDTSKKQNFT